MAESETGQEKSEPATARKRSQSREQGNVPRSMDLNTTVMLIAGVVSFYLYAAFFYGNVAEAIYYYLDQCGEYDITEVSAWGLMVEVGIWIFKILAPFFIIFVIAALVINLAQVGFLFIIEPLKPNFKKLNPITGLKRFFQLRTQVELLKSVGKMFIILPVMIYTVYTLLLGLMDLMNMEVLDILIYIGYGALNVAIRALLILVVLSIADLVYQRWQNEQDLKMTKEEVKQEMKDIQGDPIIKSRIRTVQMEMARRRMMQEVPKADVVVTNPTEYAIALRYQTEEMSAPMVVAKGRGELAKRIKEIALEHAVPIVENRWLAQSLYKLVEVGDIIPPDLYKAVAEVLAYVYRLNNRMAGTG